MTYVSLALRGDVLHLQEASFPGGKREECLKTGETGETGETAKRYEQTKCEGSDKVFRSFTDSSMVAGMVNVAGSDFDSAPPLTSCAQY